MFSLIVAGLFVLGGLTGCTSAPSVGARGVDYAPAVSELRELVRSEMDRLGIPCAGIALVDGNQIIWEKGFGWQDAEAGVPATEETVYRVGSISKLFTATAKAPTGGSCRKVRSGACSRFSSRRASSARTGSAWAGT
jgi:CubicO group peptidase (beta-lactamase class C family)